jgi:energy-coupling factor transporter ATP-binding protein EcfA2
MTKPEWSWNEKAVQKALEDFRSYLQSDEGKKHIKQHDDRRQRAQKFLKDEATIDGLTGEQLAELLRDTDAYVGNKKAVGEIERGNADHVKKGKEWLKNLIAYDGQSALPTTTHLGVGYASELLTMRFPERFYLVNNVSIEGMRRLGQGSLPERSPAAYSQWHSLFEDLLECINEVVQREIGRPANFYDVDMFLWYVATHLRDDQQLTNGVPSLVRYFRTKGFQFDEKQVVAFYAALKTKGFVILSGLSGTGKTKLAQLLAELLCPKCGEGKQDQECTHLFLSVRPDWRDSKALLGYYNPLTERYESTPLLEFLLRAAEEYQQNKGNAQPYFIILDEMNLAYVEYYFADFLSVLESGRYTEEDVSEQEKDKIGWTKESLRLERIGNLPLPPNLYIIGTVNIDETTYMFSPKVLDRAFTLGFREVDFSKEKYPPKVDEEKARRIAEQIREEILEDLQNGGKFCAAVADKKKVPQAVDALSGKKLEIDNLNRNLLQPYDLHFGYRVLDEIALFVRNARERLMSSAN